MGAKMNPSKDYVFRQKLMSVINDNQEERPRVIQAQQYLADIYGRGQPDYKGIEKFLGGRK